MKKSVGQELQNWLIRNSIGIIDSLFVPAVDHAIANAVRDHVKRRATSDAMASDGCESASTAI